MVIQTREIDLHWNYLLAIETDLKELSRYVEFDKRNFDCFSIEIARILLAAGAEVDVVCKQICTAISPKSKADNIHKYRNGIKPKFVGIPLFQVSLPRFGLKLKPWDEWTKANGVPLWWTAYNKVKHHRDAEYQRANLKNVLNAVSGLFVMLLHLYKAKGQLEDYLSCPQLLNVDVEHIGGRLIGGYDSGIRYRI